MTFPNPFNVGIPVTGSSAPAENSELRRPDSCRKPPIISSAYTARRSKQLFKESKPNTTGAREATMISSDSRSSPGLARWAESYEAKCERRQETRENRRRRRNETTCRQPGKVLRTQHKERLQGARQLQFLKRRNLEEEKKGQAREQGPSSKTDGGTGQVSILKESLPGANKASFPGQQETGISSEVFPALHHSSSGIQRDLGGHHASHGRAFPPQDSDIKKPHRQHRDVELLS